MRQECPISPLSVPHCTGALNCYSKIRKLIQQHKELESKKNVICRYYSICGKKQKNPDKN
jgi:hypothetical protein